jgi:hypothetical protein
MNQLPSLIKDQFLIDHNFMVKTNGRIEPRVERQQCGSAQASLVDGIKRDKDWLREELLFRHPENE